MKPKFQFSTLLICLAIASFTSTGFSKNPAPSIKEEAVTYTANGVTMKGFITYDENIKGKRPAVLIVPEWWGLNDYIKMRARKLAELGYIAMATDMFGNGALAANPTEAQELTMPFYKDPKLGKERLDAALVKIKEYKETDPGKIAAIGYCFGGFVVLNSAKLGADLKGVVSFHGILTGVPVTKQLLKAKILVCHGANDKFVSQKDMDVLKHQLDSVGADNTFRVYSNATHAFTNPNATKAGKEFNIPIEYNEKADIDSWKDMQVFFGKLFK
jgi:dienelactone hydrolase